MTQFITRNASWLVTDTLDASTWDVLITCDDEDITHATFTFEKGDQLWLQGTITDPVKLLRAGVRLFLWSPQKQLYTELLLGRETQTRVDNEMPFVTMTSTLTPRTYEIDVAATAYSVSFREGATVVLKGYVDAPDKLIREDIDLYMPDVTAHKYIQLLVGDTYDTAPDGSLELT